MHIYLVPATQGCCGIVAASASLLEKRIISARAHEWHKVAAVRVGKVTSGMLAAWVNIVRAGLVAIEHDGDRYQHYLVPSGSASYVPPDGLSDYRCCERHWDNLMQLTRDRARDGVDVWRCRDDMMVEVAIHVHGSHADGVALHIPEHLEQEAREVQRAGHGSGTPELSRRYGRSRTNTAGR